MCNIRFFFIFIVFSGMVQAQPGTIGSHFENSQLVRDLSGYKWKMKFMLPGEGIKEGLHELPPEDIETLVWNPAHVPGDVYTDSWLAGLIDDPYFGRNSSKAQWVANYEWWYTYQFDVTEDIGNQVIRLDFDGIDYSCDIWLNGHHLGRHEGAFSNFSYDITAYLNTSKHWLKSKNMLTIKLDPPPKVNAKVAGRKTPWFGDYWRDLIPFGIWQPIRMVSTGKTRILDAYANSKEIATSLAKVDLEIEVENTTNVARDIQIISSIEGKNFDQKPVTFEIKRNIPPGKHIIVQPIEVKNPKLWWPWDLGDPNLYTLKISIKEENVNQDFKETSFGIRTVEMAWNPGFTKEEVSLPRTTMINDKFHFIRSAVWGGP
ncbi:MAG: sugar-binding domain-containing protein, partial [Lutimonas sp.]